MVRERSIETTRALERFAEAMMGLTKTWKDLFVSLRSLREMRSQSGLADRGLGPVERRGGEAQFRTSGVTERRPDYRDP